jgi:hypothetical protein
MMEAELQQQIKRLATGDSVSASVELRDSLALWGIDVDVQGDTLRLASPLQLLDTSAILDGLDAPVAEALTGIEVHWSVKTFT